MRQTPATSTPKKRTNDRKKAHTHVRIHTLTLNKKREQKNFVNLSLTLIKALVMKNATSALQIASNCWNKRNTHKCIHKERDIKRGRGRERKRTCNPHENK